MSPPQEQDPDIASLDPMPGRVVGGNFRIDKLIGAGAMGNVYKALQISLGKPVAVKILHHHLLSDEKLVARFKREAKSASLLNHPNSIQIIDSGEDRDGTLYIAMELLTGRDLAQVIRDDFPLPLLRIGRIMSQVLNALDEAHIQGVIHRDLKPSNIMLIERRGEKDFVKVCDFGIAKATLSDGADDRSAMLTVQGLVCGTPEYMSPEQARAEPLDGRSDLYSAAVILYQLTTGDIPFRADSAMGIISRHLSEPPVPPSRRRPDLDIPTMIDQVVLRGLEKNRDLRFENAVAFRDAIEALLSMTTGIPTPLPASVRAAMPTAPAMAGSPPTPIDTARVPSTAASSRFATTANMTGRSSTRQRVIVVASLAIVLGGSAVVAFGGRSTSAHGCSRSWRLSRRLPTGLRMTSAARPRPPSPSPRPRHRRQRRRRRPLPNRRSRPRRRRGRRTGSAARSRRARRPHPPCRHLPRPYWPKLRRRSRLRPPPRRKPPPPPRAASARCWARRRSCSGKAKSATPAPAVKKRSGSRRSRRRCTSSWASATCAPGGRARPTTTTSFTSSSRPLRRTRPSSRA